MDIGSKKRSSIQDLCNHHNLIYNMLNQTQGSQNQTKEAQQDGYWQQSEEFYLTPMQPPQLPL
ncbi:hypothetical protein DVH24_015575 [Malus domestica]|uniref:Uncharacterized protein n=1 Tax=Malus domestica TaxID=3750 RepID=A0A498HQ05_MALDO|nr:hypothetical protein DVH24_015575 [Malus domestica]